MQDVLYSQFVWPIMSVLFVSGVILVIVVALANGILDLILPAPRRRRRWR
jgi:hypothetical protein